jgi:hypothetical protein
MNEIGGEDSAYGEERGVHRVLVGKFEVKRPLGRPRRRWEYNTKTDLPEHGGIRRDRIEMAQDRDRWRALVSALKKLRIP